MNSTNFEQAGSGFPRILSRTYLDDVRPSRGAYWSVSVRHYPQNLAECSYSKVPADKNYGDPKNRKSKKPKSDDAIDLSRKSMSEEDLDRANRRARTTVRRKAMMLGADHLLTLTYKENEQDRVKAWGDFTRYMRLVREAIPGWKYVATMEYQKRGAIHFHLAVVGKQDVVLLRRLWKKVVGEVWSDENQKMMMNGNIDVSYKEHMAANTRAVSLAKYVAKYISKSFDPKAQKGEHRYRASLGIRECVLKFYAPAIFSYAGFHIKQFFEGQILSDVKSHFSDPVGNNFGWMATW